MKTSSHALRSLRGAPLAALLACAFFTSFTGVSGVIILALGGLVMSVLLSAGYASVV